MWTRFLAGQASLKQSNLNLLTAKGWVRWEIKRFVLIPDFFSSRIFSDIPRSRIFSEAWGILFFVSINTENPSGIAVVVRPVPGLYRTRQLSVLSVILLYFPSGNIREYLRIFGNILREREYSRETHRDSKFHSNSFFRKYSTPDGHTTPRVSMPTCSVPNAGSDPNENIWEYWGIFPGAGNIAFRSMWTIVRKEKYLEIFCIIRGKILFIIFLPISHP